MASLKDKYCIVGVGETEYSRQSARSTRAMAVEAVRNAMRDAGLGKDGVDGMMSYQSGDSIFSNFVAPDLGIRLNFYMDCSAAARPPRRSSGLAIGAIEAGMCHTVAIFRSMNGYSDFRIGGTGARAAQPVRGIDLAQVPFGMRSAGQNFAPTFMRHMYEYGTTSEQVAHVRVAHSKHASQNPKAFHKERVTVDDVVGSRWICKPLHLLDCCLETDNATALIVTSAERARDLRRKPVYIMGVAGRVNKPRTDFHWAHGPITRVAGYYAKDIVFGQAGIKPDDVNVTGCYDAFTFTTMLQLEEYGFCKKGEGGQYVSSGIIELGGKRPNNTSRRPPLRGLHPRHVDGDRERAPAPRPGGRLLPRLGGRQAHLRLLARQVPPGEGRARHHEPRLGDAADRLRPHHEELAMASVEYRGMNLVIPENDSEWREHFKLARTSHQLMLRACRQCQPDALSPEPRLPLVHVARVGLEGGERARAHLLLRGRAPRDPARLQGVDALRGGAGRARRAARRAHPGRGPARHRQPRDAGRSAPSRRRTWPSASGSAWSSRTWPRTSRCRSSR